MADGLSGSNRAWSPRSARDRHQRRSRPHRRPSPRLPAGRSPRAATGSNSSVDGYRWSIMLALTCPGQSTFLEFPSAAATCRWKWLAMRGGRWPADQAGGTHAIAPAGGRRRATSASTSVPFAAGRVEAQSSLLLRPRAYPAAASDRAARPTRPGESGGGPGTDQWIVPAMPTFSSRSGCRRRDREQASP